jgi:Ca2+-binding RTX toxin-like protein
MRFVRSGGGVRLTDTNAPVTAGTGCQQQGPNAVVCSGVEFLNVNGRDGDDFIANSTNIGSVISGGNGNDVLLGGTVGDQLIGNVGNDRANGGLGVDICNAESESSCEQD